MTFILNRNNSQIDIICILQNRLLAGNIAFQNRSAILEKNREMQISGKKVITLKIINVFKNTEFLSAAFFMDVSTPALHNLNNIIISKTVKNGVKIRYL